MIQYSDIELEAEAWAEYQASTMGQAASWEEIPALEQEYLINIVFADREQARYVNKPISEETFAGVPF
jgi:hypothetical protein